MQFSDDYELCTEDNPKHNEICTKKCKATGRLNGSCTIEKDTCSCLNNKQIWEKLQEKEDSEDTNQMQHIENTLKVDEKENKELIEKALESGFIKRTLLISY